MARRRTRTRTPLGQRVLSFALVACLLVAAGRTVQLAIAPGPWQRVLATREGEIGKRTATGFVIAPDSMFVALPHRMALHKHVELRYGTRVLVVPVLDVGPWNIDDDYWTGGGRPASERGRGYFRTPVNRAGIDLSDPVFAALGLADNDVIEWRFVHQGYYALPWL